MDARLKEFAQLVKDSPEDRTAINTVLRRMLKGVVVDYRSGTLILQWQHSDEKTSLFYTFPE